MKRIVVIGLGTFGHEVAATLAKRKHEVIAVDRDRARVDEIKDEVATAAVADATDREALEQIGLKDLDAAVVALGERYFANAIMVTLALRELGVEEIYVKAVSPAQGRALRKVGATEAINPEEEMGRRLGDRLAAGGVIEHISFPEGCAIVELPAPKPLWGKTLADSQIRRRHGIDVLVVKRGYQNADPSDDEAFIVPDADATLEEGDLVVVFGTHKAIKKLKDLG